MHFSRFCDFLIHNKSIKHGPAHIPFIFWMSTVGYKVAQTVTKIIQRDLTEWIEFFTISLKSLEKSIYTVKLQCTDYAPNHHTGLLRLSESSNFSPGITLWRVGMFAQRNWSLNNIDLSCWQPFNAIILLTMYTPSYLLTRLFLSTNLANNYSTAG